MNSPAIHNPAVEKSIAGLSSIYTVANPAEVHIFLMENVELLETLQIIPLKMREFGLNGELHLELDQYPDSEDDRRLIVSVHSDADPDAMGNALDEFDEGWWLDHLASVGSRICTVLRFQ